MKKLLEKMIITKTQTTGKVIEILSRKRVKIELRDENGNFIYRTPYIAWCEEI
jgi:translation initiation factor IF-1